MSERTNNFDDIQAIEYLKNLDARISRIEARLNLSSYEHKTEKEEAPPLSEKDIKPDEFEYNLGEFWFAGVSIVILAIGFAFLLTLPFNEVNVFIPNGIGLAIVAGLFSVAYRWENSLTFISKQFWAAGFILLYFSVLRLYHFTSNPVIQSTEIELISLLIVVAICFYLAYRKKSPYLIALSLTMLLITGLIFNSPIIILILNIFAASSFVYFFSKYSKSGFLIYGIILSYLVHLVWAINNPLIGNTVELMHEPFFNFLFVLGYAVIYSLVGLTPVIKEFDEDVNKISTILNAFSALVVYLIINLSAEASSILYHYILLFLVFSILASVYWTKKGDNFAAAVYSLLGFAGLSIGIIAAVEIPYVYILLVWQSLLVAAAAIWFRSKNIIVINFLIFLLIFIVYIITVGAFQFISLSFGIVALISARIMNWQKDHLTIRTELMRNIFLTIAFFSIPFTLLKTFEPNFVGVSWIVVTLIYYTLSLFLNNYKYRWMGHLTLLATLVYSLAVGLTHFDAVYKVITFLSIGIILMVISITYSKFKLKVTQNEGESTVKSTQ